MNPVTTTIAPNCTVACAFECRACARGRPASRTQRADRKRIGGIAQHREDVRTVTNQGGIGGAGAAAERHGMGVGVSHRRSLGRHGRVVQPQRERRDTGRAAGYDESAPLMYGDSLRGSFLLVHGTGDDNVHFQNSERLVERLEAANKQFDMRIYPTRRTRLPVAPRGKTCTVCSRRG